MKDPSNIRDRFKRFPRLYRFVLIVFSPMYWSGVSPKGFFKRHANDKTILNLGSGPDVIDPKVTNVDMYEYAGVSVVADIMALPFNDNSVDAIICNTVLEHVRDPKRALKEMKRVLLPGGEVYITVPFLYPFHSSPVDFHRWTHEGLKDFMSEFDIKEIGVRAGPFSTLTVWLCYIFAAIFCFGSETVYWVLMNLAMFPLFPLKLLDIVASKLPFAINISSILYAIGKKADA